MWKRIQYIFDKKQKTRLIQLFGVILIGAFIELLGVTAILPFINALITPDELMNAWYIELISSWLNVQTTEQIIVFLACLIIGVYIIKNLYIVFMYEVMYRFVYNNRKRLACKMMEGYIKQPYLYHVSHNSAELIRNINNDTSSFFDAVQSFIQLITELLVCVVLVSYLFFMDVMITSAVAVSMLIFVLFYLKILRGKVKHFGENVWAYNAKLNKCILQAFGGIKEIKVLDRQENFIKQYEDQYNTFAYAQQKYNVLVNLPRPLMESVCIVALMVAIVIQILVGVKPEEFIPVVSVFAIAAFRLLPSVTRMSLYAGQIAYNRAAVDNVYNDLREMEELQKNIEQEDKRCEEVISIEKEITFKNIHFRYPGISKYVFENVNIVIPVNQSVAFVGPSGQGKTTLVDIMLGLLRPEKGEIFADGKNIHTNLKSWLEHVGYISQSIYLIDDTIEKNVAFGIPEKEIDRNRVWKALEDAQLKAFVEKLPDGLDTIVGEVGARLSGGQKQRIGIARALYNDPEILVLDEATSALDTETETAVMESIEHLSKSKTLIVIAHRLSTIENCDVVYEVNEGSVMEKRRRTS